VFDHHRIEKFWRYYECSTDMPSQENLREHLRNQHHTILSDSQFTMAMPMAQVNRPTSFEDMKCPLCLSHPGDTRRAFETHVGKHMEEIALASLPREGSGDSAEESKVSNDSDDDVSTSSEDVPQPHLSTDWRSGEPHNSEIGALAQTSPPTQSISHTPGIKEICTAPAEAIRGVHGQRDEHDGDLVSSNLTEDLSHPSTTLNRIDEGLESEVTQTETAIDDRIFR
jgi:hypothetical protein